MGVKWIKAKNASNIFFHNGFVFPVPEWEEEEERERDTTLGGRGSTPHS